MSLIAATALALLAPALPAPAAPESGSSTIGVVPPQDPNYFCYPQLRQQIDSIDYCRAQEGVGPLILPDNYGSLSPQRQMFVVFNLERVNRGLAPVVGLSASLDGYAQQGADSDGDPPFPPDPGNGGGGIWDPNTSTLGADDAFMYTDDCTPKNVVGCWGHRDAILTDSDTTDPLDGGGGFKLHGDSPRYNSYTFEFIYAYQHNDLVFTWQDELSHFATPPAVEPVQPPTITGITPSLTSTAGGGVVTIHGTNLISTKTIEVGNTKATHVRCETEMSCSARVPAHAAGTVAVRLTTVDRTSPTSRHAQLTYAKPTLKRIGSARRSVREGQAVSKPFTVRAALGGTPVADIPVRFTGSYGTYFPGGGGSRTIRTGRSGEATTPKLTTDYGIARASVTARIPGAPPVKWRIHVRR